MAGSWRMRSLGVVCAVLLCVGVCKALDAQQTAAAGAAQTQVEAMPLWPAGQVPGAQGQAAEDVPVLLPFLPANNPTHSAVIVAPGGGYGHLSMEKEGSDVARWLNARGVAAFVLRYRLGPKYRNPVELGDAQRAIRLVRSEAARFGVEPNRIAMMGFSAGGHLAATAGTLFEAGDPAAADAVDRVSSRPDLLILAYPVITMTDPYVHKGSRDNLLGSHPEQEMVERLSPEKHVNRTTPPTFLFATADDPVVPAQNSTMFFNALIAAHVPAELHLFEHGPHGVGLAPTFPELKVWPELLAGWLVKHGWIAPPPPA